MLGGEGVGITSKEHFTHLFIHRTSLIITSCLKFYSKIDNHGPVRMRENKAVYAWEYC